MESSKIIREVAYVWLSGFFLFGFTVFISFINDTSGTLSGSKCWSMAACLQLPLENQCLISMARTWFKRNVFLN